MLGELGAASRDSLTGVKRQKELQQLSSQSASSLYSYGNVVATTLVISRMMTTAWEQQQAVAQAKLRCPSGSA